MNDNEIMKSLDACDNCFCENCSYKSKTIYCREELIKDALSLIRHQKSEIERLSKEIITLKYDLHVAGEESIEWKSTAIKEFAERLKENIDNGQLYNDGEDYALTIWHIDNLVKEMTESEGKENA